MKKEKKNNILFIFLVFILIGYGLFFIKKGWPKTEDIEPLYTYRIDRNLNYNVTLAPNEFYENNQLPSGGLYPSNLIDNIDLDFHFNYSGSRKSNLFYEYNIVAELIGEYEQKSGTNKEIWQKKFILVEDKKNKSQGTSIIIDDKAKINYSYYQELANSYKEVNNLSINAYLIVKMNIKVDNTIEGIEDNLYFEDSIESKIPLNTTATELVENYQKNTTKTINNDEEKNSNSIIIFIIIGLILLLIACALLIMKLISKTESIQEKYTKEINHILKEYSDLIVTVAFKPDIEDLRIMVLKKFDDLIDVAEQSKNNIIQYENIRENKSTLYVIANNYVYIYVVDGKS